MHWTDLLHKVNLHYRVTETGRRFGCLLRSHQANSYRTVESHRRLATHGMKSQRFLEIPHVEILGLVLHCCCHKTTLADDHQSSLRHSAVRLHSAHSERGSEQHTDLSRGPPTVAILMTPHGFQNHLGRYRPSPEESASVDESQSSS